MPEYTDKYDTLIQSAIARHWPECPDWRWGKAQLIAESNLNPDATSPVGAAGIAQFMPDTWGEVMGALGTPQASVRDPEAAIPAYAWYMNQLWQQWRAPRPQLDRLQLSQAAYNTGLGNMLKAQKLARGAAGYSAISAHLVDVTGDGARETQWYIINIARVFAQLIAIPFPPDVG